MSIPLAALLALAATSAAAAPPTVPWVSLPERPLVANPDHAGAFGYEPTAAIVYIAGDGLSVSASCGDFDGESHSALGCSPIVMFDAELEPWADPSEVAGVFATAQQQFEAYNAVFTTARPPDWIPYTMVVLADGEAIGQPDICGRMNPVCDGYDRRGISFLFRCSVTPTRFVANSIARPLGLEQVEAPEDHLYEGTPNFSASFTDQCLDLPLGSQDCTYVHELYCDNNQQNSHQELLGMLGPREVDDQPPVIVSIFPEGGANIESDQALLITAEVEENSNFIAARWTLNGGGEEIDRCTNGLCDFDFDIPLGTPTEDLNWDFLELGDAPLGEYVLTFEVADAYGGFTSRTITFNIVEPGFSDSGSSSGGPDGSSTSTTDGSSASGSDSADDGDAPPGGTTGTAEGSSGSTDGPTAADQDKGCGCQSGEGGVPGLLALSIFAFFRRRRPANAGTRPSSTAGRRAR